ncbi:cyclase family protein [Halobacterium sp. CBA1126]|uniref:cyclase family protein n=1 Tax=Halobacterium sp. CBA1126 TaxID=2668074 RepID=UPI001E53BC3B|nr:cyclase family protein [Halobacterium sp. CBA1126]
MWDLTHELGSGLPYPGDPPASVTPHATFEADGYRVADVACSTHSGTHVDAPAHLLEDGATLGAYDVETFAFDARVVDCTDAGAREAIPAGRVPGDRRRPPRRPHGLERALGRRSSTSTTRT